MLRELHTKLGIPQDYGLDGAKAAFDEAAELIDAGVNPSGRMQQLTPEAAVGWETMMAAASADGLPLLIVAGCAGMWKLWRPRQMGSESAPVGDATSEPVAS